MLNAGQPGFLHAPVSKCFVTCVVLSTLFASIVGSHSRALLQMSEVIEKMQLWRLITHCVVFNTPGEVLFGVILLYFFRQFERQLGSSKFAAYSLISGITYTCLLVAWQLAVPSVVPASGPYFLVFASVVYFFFETPKIYHFQIVGMLELSDKSFVYLLAIQLILSSPPRSLISCAAGILAGIVYRVPFIRENAEMPQMLVNFCSQNVLPLLGTTSRSGSRGRGRQAAAAWAASGRGTTRANGANERDGISRQNIETLLGMGFERADVIMALQRSNDDVERATDLLLRRAG